MKRLLPTMALLAVFAAGAIACNVDDATSKMPQVDKTVTTVSKTKEPTLFVSTGSALLDNLTIQYLLAR